MRAVEFGIGIFANSIDQAARATKVAAPQSNEGGGNFCAGAKLTCAVLLYHVARVSSGTSLCV